MATCRRVKFLWRMFSVLVIRLRSLRLLRVSGIVMRLRIDRKSGSAGMPRPISYAVFCLKQKNSNLGITLHMEGQPEQAVHLLLQALARDPNFLPANLILGLDLVKL